MILLESRDKRIWQLDKKTIEIVNDAISTTGPIIINLTGEGPCLRSCNFYNILDDISQTFNIDKTRFIIQTCNVEEYHDEYNIEIQNNSWIDHCKKIQTNNGIKNLTLNTVGCFVGKINWNRLVLLGWLDKFFNEKSLLTCHYNNNSQSQLSALELNEIFQICPDEIHAAINFLKICPKKITNINMHYDKKITFNNMISITNELSSSYHMIFSELVCETYYSGLTFFPTEKTFRPIMQLTPTITFGSRGFLSNMQRCGFKTFSDYWDESYDDLQDYERIQAIQSVLKKLFLLDHKDLTDMYEDMLPILMHNKNRLVTMQPEELKLVG